MFEVVYVVAPASRLRRGARRLALTICALILGAGFSPVWPSTVERPAAASNLSFTQRSTVDAPADADPVDQPPVVTPLPQAVLDTQLMPDGRPVGAVAGRAPPRTSA